MLAELSAANAAFAVIKTAVQNSGDLLKAGQAIADFVNAKDSLHQRANKKKNSLFGDPNKTSDIEEFIALEQIREREEELKQYMIYCGRPGLWNDWIKFQADARVERQRQRKLAEERREEILVWATIIGAVILGSSLFIWFIYMFKFAGN